MVWSDLDLIRDWIFFKTTSPDFFSEWENDFTVSVSGISFLGAGEKINGDGVANPPSGSVSIFNVSINSGLYYTFWALFSGSFSHRLSSFLFVYITTFYLFFHATCKDDRFRLKLFLSLNKFSPQNGIIWLIDPTLYQRKEKYLMPLLRVNTIYMHVTRETTIPFRWCMIQETRTLLEQEKRPLRTLHLLFVFFYL